MRTEFTLDEVRHALERLAANASRELPAKQPHWGDAILCDGLLYAARVLKTRAPVEAAERWFAPKLAAGPRFTIRSKSELRRLRPASA